MKSHHTPLFPASGPATGSFNGIHPKSNFLAIALFDQENDIAEKTNVAAAHPEIAEKIGSYLKTARTESPEWESKWQGAKTRSSKHSTPTTRTTTPP